MVKTLVESCCERPFIYSFTEYVVFVAGRVEGTQRSLPWCTTIFTEMLDHKSNKL